MLPTSHFSTRTQLLSAASLAFLLIAAARHAYNRNINSINETSSDGEPRTDGWWTTLHQQLVQEAATKQHKSIFYGDSITESLRGTSSGHPVYAANAQIFKEKILDGDGGVKYEAAALGISADETPHLLWRLRTGEFSKVYPPDVAVVLIGTNDIWRARVTAQANGGHSEAAAMAEAVAVVVENMQRMVRYMQTVAPKTKVLLVGLLPRGCCTPPAKGSSYEQPSVYSKHLEAVNRRYAEMARKDSKRLRFVNCTAAFLTPDSKALDREKLPDQLHPVGPGAAALLDCIKPPLDGLLES